MVSSCPIAGGEMIPDDIMKSLQDTLKDPEMMKKIQDMAMGFFKGFPPSTPSSSESTDPVKKDSKSKKKNDTDENDDDSDEGFKIDIE